MNYDEKGKQFLELIDEQNNLQWSIIAKLSSLISLEWNSEELQNQIQTLVKQHSKITRDLNNIDNNLSCYSAESTISAMNSTAKYGLENLNSVHAALSIGFTITHIDSATINAPDAIAVHKYVSPTIA